MNLTELNRIARAMVAPGKGILAADESSGTIKKRFDAIKVESTEESRRDYREMLFRSTEAMSQYISGVILYDETIWQNAKDGTPLVKLIEQAGAIPGIKVDEGTQGAAACPGELVTVGPRQARRAAEEILRARRALRQMARGDRHRRRHPASHDRDPRQCACAGALCGAVPGRADRADRRAGSADGRRSRHRPLLRGDEPRAQQDLPGIARAARRAGRHGAEAEHGDLRQEVREAGLRRGGRGEDHAAAEGLRAGGGARHRLPLRRPVGRGGDRASQRHAPARPPALAAHLLLRPRAAGGAAEGLVRQAPRTSPPASAPSPTAPA